MCTFLVCTFLGCQEDMATAAPVLPPPSSEQPSKLGSLPASNTDTDVALCRSACERVASLSWVRELSALRTIDPTLLPSDSSSVKARVAAAIETCVMSCQNSTPTETAACLAKANNEKQLARCIEAPSGP